ncbi:MAG TPA: exodeoxyribonuclease VII large subunit [Steroidobacteraceae bacterium]|nr:exodeoxyribonuclease VII large subunit [Steroidobacteraceae bacterium]
MDQAPSSASRPQRTVYSVSRLNREVRWLLEQRLPVLWVEGELSNLSQPGSGHWYFSLKDRDAQLRCAMFHQRNVNVSFVPRVGQHVLARGRVTLFEPRGEYQLIVEHLEDAGLGALQREFERLKTRLAAEGLFSEARKRKPPRMPARIGIITSPTGAALRDIVHILQRRFPAAPVLIYPTPVQGRTAAPAIARAIGLASARADCDVLILARGGGSLEDLWPFNDERVARAIHACAVPIVAGIGHEIDFTIADFVADVRAPTPSGAAELVTPERATVLRALSKTRERLSACMARELRAVTGRLNALDGRLRRVHPGVRVLQQVQRLDDLEQRLTGAMRGCLHGQRNRLSERYAQLVRLSPDGRVRDYRARHAAVEARLRHAIAQRVGGAAHKLGLAQRALDAVSPLATLTRGFAIVTRVADGALLTDAETVQVGEDIEARLARGRVRARTTGKSGEEAD